MPDDVALAEPQAARCAAHPRVETYLRCGRCETPICPRCLIQTPVGARCRSCAQVRRLPIYDVGPRYLLRGALAGLGSAILAGAVIQFFPGFGLFVQVLLGAFYGYVVAGAVSAATNRKRGLSLCWSTVGAILLGYLLSRAALATFQFGHLAVGARLGRSLAAGFSPDLGTLLLLLIASVIAFNRLR